MHNAQFLIDNLPLFIPLIILELALMVTAVVSLAKSTKFRFGNKPMWLVIVIIFQIIGPVVYFVFGKGERE